MKIKATEQELTMSDCPELLEEIERTAKDRNSRQRLCFLPCHLGRSKSRVCSENELRPLKETTNTPPPEE